MGMLLRLWLASDLHIEYPRDLPPLFAPLSIEEGEEEGSQGKGREEEKREEIENTMAKAKTKEKTSGSDEVKDVVALLGDIGNPLSLNKTYSPFLSSLSFRFERVLVVAGNK
jgi:hypothetical protein